MFEIILQKFLLISILLLILSNCSVMEQNGYIEPKKLKTENINVVSNGFLYTYRLGKKLDMQYFITLQFPNIDEISGKYIIIEYQDPIKKDKFLYEILPIKKNEDAVYLKSKVMYGFKNMRSYLIKISLSDNQYGNKILENIEQYARVQYIPSDYKNEM